MAVCGIDTLALFRDTPAALAPISCLWERPRRSSEACKAAHEQSSKERTARPCPTPHKQIKDRYGFVIVAHEHRKRQEAARE